MSCARADVKAPWSADETISLKTFIRGVRRGWSQEEEIELPSLRLSLRTAWVRRPILFNSRGIPFVFAQ